MDEIVRCAALDGADTFPVDLFEVAAEDAVTARVRVPKRHVDRVERPCDVEWSFLDSGPAEAVCRNKAVEVIFTGAADGFEPLFRWCVRIAVQEDTKIVGFVTPIKDVVVRRTF